MTLADLSTYQKLTARAADPTAPAEQASAARMVKQMETDNPGIGRASRLAQRAIDDPLFGLGATPAAAPSGGGWRDKFADLAAGTAARMADGLASEVVEMARRTEPLAKGEVSIKRHDCASDQVCVEVRCRARDWEPNRRDILRAVQDEMDDAVEDG